MNVEEAIVSALDYERRVRDYYTAKGNGIPDPKGKEVFALLAKEEQGHVDYLESKLKKWRVNGVLDKEALITTVPSREWIEKGKAKMKGVPLKRDLTSEIKLLKEALKLEEEVSDHYRLLVASLTDDAQEMFRRFLAIEDGHTAIVQAEIDSLEGNAFWFDFAEFNLEAG